MKKVRVALCLMILMLLIPAIFRLRGKLPNDTQPLIEKKYGGWAGVLRLWVYEGWQPGAGSAAAWLNRCISSFEKAHPGVYIQPEYVDASAMRALGRDGLLSPDMALFPPGAVEAEIMEGASAVMFGGYMWAYNAALIEGIPRDWQNAEVVPAVLPDEAHRHWRVALLALCSGKYQEDAATEEIEFSGELELGLSSVSATLSPTAIPSDGPLRCVLPVGFTPSADAWRDFLNGDVAAIPVTQREIRKLQALSEDGKGVDWKLAGGGAFTDQVLYIGVVKKAEAEKIELCRAFVRHLLSDRCQGELHRIGAFSATGAASGYAGGDPLSAMEAMLRQSAPCVPGAFDADWARDVDGIVQKFIDGDADPAALWGMAMAKIGQNAKN